MVHASTYNEGHWKYTGANGRHRGRDEPLRMAELILIASMSANAATLMIMADLAKYGSALYGLLRVVPVLPTTLSYE